MYSVVSGIDMCLYLARKVSSHVGIIEFVLKLRYSYGVHKVAVL